MNCYVCLSPDSQDGPTTPTHIGCDSTVTGTTAVAEHSNTKSVILIFSSHLCPLTVSFILSAEPNALKLPTTQPMNKQLLSVGQRRMPSSQQPSRTKVCSIATLRSLFFHSCYRGTVSQSPVLITADIEGQQRAGATSDLKID